MNILELGLLYNEGGASTVMHQIASDMEDNKNKVFIIAAFNQNNRPVRKGDLILFKTNEREIVANRTYLRDRYGLINELTFFKILFFSIKKRIDVIHLHAVQEFLGIREIALLSKLYSVVWTLHDCWAFTGKCLHTYNCGGWKTEECKKCNQFGGIDVGTLYRLKKRWFKNSNIIFTAPSKWLLEKAKSSFLSQERFFNIPNGINVEDFTVFDKQELRKKYGIQAEKKLLLFCAADVGNRFKGYRILKAAIDKLPRDEYVLLIMGKAKQVGSSDFNCVVRKLGYIEDTREKNEIFSLADVMVIPSLQENFPCVVLESMASGTPVIGFDVGGIPEQLSGNCGWICAGEKRGTELAETIRQAFGDPSDMAARGINAREKAVNNYCLKKIVGKYKKVYGKAINK